MQFLSNAIFSEVDQSLLGLVLTEFAPEPYTGRCQTKLYTTKELMTAYPTMVPRGFMLDEKGGILSDAGFRKEMTSSVFSYMENECEAFGKRTLDITDLVLQGVDANGFVLQGFKSLEDYGTPVLFSTFQVSNSSFNIYSRYKTSDSEFRTVSLLETESGAPKELYIAMPLSSDLSSYGSAVSYVGDCLIEDGEYRVYRVILGLASYYAEVGEAFLNYLAYNIAYYNIGEQTLRELKEANRPTPQRMNLGKSEIEMRPRRRARVNVSIEHEFKETRIRSIVRALDSEEHLTEVLNGSYEAKITWEWVQKLYGSEWYTDSYEEKGEDEARYIAATNLIPCCRTWRLKYALELLTHRYYLALLGLGNDSLGLILKGGGVYGESVKRCDFGNN